MHPVLYNKSFTAHRKCNTNQFKGVIELFQDRNLNQRKTQQCDLALLEIEKALLKEVCAWQNWRLIFFSPRSNNAYCHTKHRNLEQFAKKHRSSAELHAVLDHYYWVVRLVALNFIFDYICLYLDYKYEWRIQNQAPRSQNFEGSNHSFCYLIKCVIFL